MKDNIIYFNKDEHKKINTKRLIGLIILLLVILLLVITYILYATNEEIRSYMDTNILHKEITQSNLKYIEIQDYDKVNIFAYYNKIAILKDNNISLYGSSGKKETDLKVEINSPIADSAGRYFAIAEKDSSKMYMIKDNEIVWEKDLEGNISKVSTNAGGYTSVILTGTAYKSVIEIFDEKGNELFKYYLSNTIAIDTSISSDCKELAIAEVNTSGTLIQSNIEIISIEKAKTSPTEAVTFNYKAEQNSLVLSVKYQTGVRLVCMYDDSVHTIKDGVDTKIADITQKDSKITYYSIQLDSNIVETLEETTGILSTQTTVKTIDTSNQKEAEYKFEGVTKELYAYGNNIAVNLGSEVHFIGINGWLKKKYSSTQEIRKIVLADDIAGIVYRNKVEIVGL